MSGAEAVRVGRSQPAAVGRAAVRILCAAAAGCAGAPWTTIPVGKLIG